MEAKDNVCQAKDEIIIARSNQAKKNRCIWKLTLVAGILVLVLLIRIF
jgi:hypothetical protein